MKTAVRIVQVKAKTLKILFVCLCIIVIFFVSFETSLVAKLNKTWCVLQSDVASLNEKTSDVVRAAKTTLLQQKDKSDNDNTLPLQPCTGSKLGNYNCTFEAYWAGLSERVCHGLLVNPVELLAVHAYSLHAWYF